MPTIAIIGAGFSGLAQARVLSRCGFDDFVVYDSAPDVGGVWSSSRTYPGLRTQNASSTYYLSELPWPKGSPDFPDGRIVQNYLETYAKKFDLVRHLQLSTEVVSAVQEPDKRWTLTTRATTKTRQPKPDAKITSKTFDYLIVASGVFQEAFVPVYPGSDGFVKAGGEVVHSSALLDVQRAKDKDVIVVGYGKSAVDCATAVSDVSKSTTVVARELVWKLPRYLANVLPYQYLLLTRVGEALFLYYKPGPVSAGLNGPLKFIRDSMVNTLGWISTKQLNLVQSGILPRGGFENIACAQISLATEGFFERVKDGTIKVKRDCAIERVEHDASGKKVAVFSDGTSLPADLILCGTGFTQKIKFLDSNIMSRFTDAKGNFLLYRMAQPLDVENLFFVGFNSSLFCPTSGEVGAMWITSVIAGTLKLPPLQQRRQEAQDFFAWLHKRSRGHCANGTNTVPFSLAVIDTLIADMNVKLPLLSYIREWLLPVSPAAYADVAAAVEKKIRAARGQ